MRIRALFVFIAIPFFQGCVSSATYHFDVSSPSPKVRLIDNRAAQDKERTSPCENGGIGNLGDKNISPDKMSLLARRMASFEQLSAGDDLSVQKFNLYLIYPHTCQNLKGRAQAAAVAGATGKTVTYGQIVTRGEGVACELAFSRAEQRFTGKSLVEAQDGIDALTGFSVSTSLLIRPLENAVDKCISDALGGK